MHDYNTLHETVVKDIVNIVSDFRKTDEIKLFNNKASFKSISKASSNLILVFPLMASTNVGIDEDIMIMKSHERKCGVMLQMLFNALCIADSDDAIAYIKNFHTNLDLNGDELDMGTFMDAMDDIAASTEESSTMIDREFYEAVREDMLRLSKGMELKYIKETSLNEYRVMSKDGRYRDCKIIEPFTEGADRAANIARNIAGANKDSVEAINKSIITTDIKKANELLPMMMVIRFYSPDKQAVMTAVVGVKARLYPIDSSQVIERIIARNKDNNGFHNFIRATTRETSFWKDFVFAVDKAKIDAISSSRRGLDAKAWRLLERRALKSKVRRSLGMANDATAITSLIISQEEVDILKKEHNVDITKMGVIKPIMNAYNLMAIMIVNTTLNTVKFLYDDDSNAYETLTFRSLERESNDKDYKQIVNLMTKVSR